jgi:hypothetical protein
MCPWVILSLCKHHIVHWHKPRQLWLPGDRRYGTVSIALTSSVATWLCFSGQRKNEGREDGWSKRYFAASPYCSLLLFLASNRFLISTNFFLVVLGLTQGLALARQALYFLSCVLSPFCFSLIFR